MLSDIDEIKVIKVTIERDKDEAESGKVKLKFVDLDNTQVDLTDSNIDDIKELFNAIFIYMVDNRQILKFEIDDSKNDLFFDVSKDIINQLNSEIAESKNDLERIWSLIPEEIPEQINNDDGPK